MRSRRTLTVLLAVMLALGACATASPEPKKSRELAWSSLRDEGIGGDDQLAVFVTTWPDLESKGFLGLVDRKGQARFLETAGQTGAALAASDEALCLSDRSETYRFAPEGVGRVDREGYPGGGHWIGLGAKDTCLLILNSGVGDSGYETDLYWEHGDQLMRGTVPAVPGPAGQSPGALWVRSAGLTMIPGDLSLYRTDLQTGKVAKVLTWSTRVEVGSGTRPTLNYDDNYASDLFWHDDELFYIEDLTAISAEGGSAEIKPGITGQVRLAEIDPLAKKVRSTLLRYTPRGLMAPSESQNAVEGELAVALRRGHYAGGSIYTADGDGNLLAVNLESKKLRTVGRFSETARKAPAVVAAWSETRLALVLTSADGEVLQETYDLQTGHLISTLPLEGFHELLSGGDLYIGGAAMLN